MTTLERLTEDRAIVARIVSVEAIYAPILARLEREIEDHQRAVLMAAPNRVVRGPRLKAQAA